MQELPVNLKDFYEQLQVKLVLMVNPNFMKQEEVFKQWKKLHSVSSTTLSQTIHIQHHAAQFIALLGRHLVRHRSDDSNTSMIWSPELSGFRGEPLEHAQPVMLGLNIQKLSLHFMDKQGYTLSSFDLEQKNRASVLSWLKEQIGALGGDALRLKDELHYEIPPHEVTQGGFFPEPKGKTWEEALNQRHNADILLQWMILHSENASQARIWPHHFDSGAVLPLEYKGQEMTKSVGIGYAPPDAMVEHPYFYVNLYDKNGVNPPASFGELPAGKWLFNGWKGAVLPLTDLYELEEPEQARRAMTFFEQAAEQGRNMLVHNA